ncbi:MAG: murein biosynthesis integral membrane protein MurJ [Verrucomicrobia bacterium]|nr:murein biosynthesis integral membrane protein MurJ [Verrucomicrobiota bacterium]
MSTKGTSRVMLAIGTSRILGLVREVLLNTVLGAGKELDALIAAFRIPNLLRDLFAEGALSTAFVTTFSQKLAKEGKAAAYRLANNVNTLLFIVLTTIVGVGILEADFLVHFFNPGFTAIPGKTELTVELTRILFPFILFLSLAAVYMGLLNSLHHFGLPALASAVFNLVSIGLGLLMAWWLDPRFGPKSVYGFAIGVLVGGLAQWLVMVPRALSVGYHGHWLIDFRDPGLRQVLRLLGPASIGAAAIQVNVLVNGYFASYLENGSVTCLNNAFRLIQLPIGLFGVAVATVTLPHLARHAALEEKKALQDRLLVGVRQTLFLTLPAAIGLFLLAEPVIASIYQYGRFTADDTARTALALKGYALGLVSYSCIKVVGPVFSAIDKPGIPLRVSLTGIFLNAGLNYLLIRVYHLGILGLTLSVASTATLNILQLVWASQRHVGTFFRPDFLQALVRIGLSCIVLIGALRVGSWFIDPLDGPVIVRVAGTLALCTLGAAAYFLAATLLGLSDVRLFFRKSRAKQVKGFRDEA